MSQCLVSNERFITFLGGESPQRFPAKGAGENLDYTFDLSQWLESGETITGEPVVTIIPSGLTTTDTQINATNVVLWLSGGTPYQDNNISVLVTTNNTPPRSKRFIANLFVTDE